MARIEVVVVRTASQTTYEEKVKKKTRTSGCAVGTVFGDMMEGLEGLMLPATEVRTSWLYALAETINRTLADALARTPQLLVFGVSLLGDALQILL